MNLMFFMPLKPAQVEALDQGDEVAVSINDEYVLLARDGKYLCYKDQDGVLNRCLILDTHDQTDNWTVFTCAGPVEEVA
jgi:hypothetical protein